MPFKSRAQRRKFAELLVEGKITPETYEEWNRETGRRVLPERVNRRKARTSTRRSRKPAAARSSTRTRSRPRKRTATRRKRGGR